MTHAAINQISVFTRKDLIITLTTINRVLTITTRDRVSTHAAINLISVFTAINNKSAIGFCLLLQ